jgi:hypothetical protein
MNEDWKATEKTCERKKWKKTGGRHMRWFRSYLRRLLQHPTTVDPDATGEKCVVQFPRRTEPNKYRKSL